MCAVFGLCENTKKEPVEHLQLSTKKDAPKPSQTDVSTTKKAEVRLNNTESVCISARRITNGSSLQKLLDPTCSFCLFIIKKLETLLPTNMTEVSCVVQIKTNENRPFLIKAFPSFPCRKL